MSDSANVPSVTACWPAATFSEETEPKPDNDRVSEPTKLLNVTVKFAASTSLVLSKFLLVVNVTGLCVTSKVPPLKL